jgi:predicted amidohydrolase YtcJ
MRLDALFTNARIRTLDDRRPTAHRIGVIGETIVGLDEELDGCSADTTVDLGGAPVVPGFHDAHHHLGWRGQRLRQLDLGPATVGSLDALYDAVARHAAGLPEHGWVIGSGYNQDLIGGHPLRHRLDEAAGGRAVFLGHTSGHMCVVSTAVIAQMGYDDPRDLPDVPGGLIERDADGLPTGLLGEQAQTLVYDLIRPEPLDGYVQAIGLAGQVALSEGITSITDPGIAGQLTGNGPADLAAYLLARERGLLGVRATLMPEVAALHPIERVQPGVDWFGLDLGLRTGFGDDWLRIGAVKVFSDGSLIGRTAAMLSDYADEPGTRGFLLAEADHLTGHIVDAHRAGWQVAVHAIGDAAVDLVLDAVEQAQRRHHRPDPRHRIEHAGIVNDAQIARMAALGVIPVPQGMFVEEIGDGMLAALGEERAHLLYRQRSFLDAGIELPGSSDCPVVTGAPLLGIHAMVNRTTAGGRVLNPAERVTPLQALRAFTIGSAYADRQEHRKGRLARGMLADFVVLSDDLLTVDPDGIRDIGVRMTVVGGRAGYDAGA